MILSAFFYIAASIINFIYAVFSAISFQFPEQVSSSFTYFVSYFRYAGIFFPIADFMSALGYIITFMTLMYLIKIFLWVFVFLPFIGKVIHLPDHAYGGSMNDDDYRAYRKSMGR